MRHTASLAFLAAALSVTWAAAQAARGAPQPPPGMVLVPAGPFPMGNNNDFYDNDFDEQPRHVVKLPPFYMSVHPVTNREYKAFADATGHRRPAHWPDSGDIPDGKAEHPVTGVDYFDATAFAAWQGRRLPTEQEWEKAARGPNGLRWPWGNSFDADKANVGTRATSAVGAHPEGCNDFGLCDMAGNVWEWTTTPYAPYPGAPPNRAILRFIGGDYLAVRGGSYGSDVGSARGADRGIKKPAESGPSLGFRTVADVPGYEGYRDALATIELAHVALESSAAHISDYDEHTDARATLAAARAALATAEDEFILERFRESGMLAQDAISLADDARQAALDVRRAYQAQQRAGTAEILGRLEAALDELPDNLDDRQSALLEQARNHLAEGRRLEAEGGWGYAQMHGYIGMGTLGRALDRPVGGR
jgi:iron(II)-dependent oxidoreductase